MLTPRCPQITTLLLLPAFALAAFAHPSTAAEQRLPAGVNAQWLESAQRAAIAASGGRIAKAPSLPAAPSAAVNLPLAPDWSREGTEGFGFFTHSMTTLGDVNGDGYSDVAIGGPFEDYNDAGDAGKVHVWYGGPDGLGTPTYPPYGEDWTGKGGLSAYLFGYSVAAAGDVNGDGYSDMFVGAPGAPSGSGQRAYVFMGGSTGMRLPNNTASNNADWKCSGSPSYDGKTQFGWSVSTAGDINGDGFDDVIAGAPTWSVSAGSIANGRFTVWLGRANFGDTGLGSSDDGTAANAAVSVSGAFAGDAMGYAVSTAGDVNGDGYDDVIVGAPNFGSGTLSGHAYLFTGNVTASPLTYTQEIAGLAANARTGYSVALAGDLNGDGYSDVIIGSPGASGGRGSATIYLGSGNASPLSLYATLTGATAGDSLGASVATAGDVNGDGYADIVVGGPSFNEAAPVGRTGYAQMYYGGPSGLRSLTPVWSTIGANRSSYGSSVATAGDVDGDGFSDVLIGSEHHGISFWGKVYLYRGAPDPPSSLAWGPTGGTPEDVLGWSVAFAGDINGDSYGDVLLGAPALDAWYVDQGAVFAYYGTANGLPVSPNWSYYGVLAGEQLGVSVAGAGDLNNDGYADIIAGAHMFFGAGGAFVWYGGPGGLPAGNPAWATIGNTANGFYGLCVAGVGDLNGDGYSDVAVGAPYENAPGTEQGRVVVFLGAPGGLSTTPSKELTGEQPGDHFGNALSWAGDVNRDGLSDLLVGAPGSNAGGADAGRAYIFNGIASALAVRATPLWTHNGRAGNAAYGGAVAHAGDVNRDGFSDILVGATGDAPGGRVEAFYGATYGPPKDPSWALNTTQGFAGFGSSLSSAGDVNNDGYSDILIGAVFFDASFGYDNGRADVHLGGPGGLSSTPYWSIDGPQDFGNLGHVVAGGGDINGDGFSDLLFGIPGFSTNYREGLAWAALGNGGSFGATSRTIAQVQLCTFCVYKTIQPMGFAASPGFYMQMRHKSAKGRDRARVRTQLAGTSALLAAASPASFTGYLDTGLGVYPFGLAGVCSGGANPCHWRIRLESHSPYFPRTPWFTLAGNALDESDVRMATPVLATDSSAPPTSLALAVAGANPARGATHLTFDLPSAGVAKVVVRDIQGRSVRGLRNGWHPVGRHEVAWDARDEQGTAVAAGVYYVELSAGGERVSRQVTLVR